MTAGKGGLVDPRNRGRTNGERVGPISQRHLLRLMKPLIDAAASKASSRTRDDSRATVRRLMAEANWNTPFILVHLGAKRCRFLASMGYVIESKYQSTTPESLARLESRRG